MKKKKKPDPVPILKLWILNFIDGEFLPPLLKEKKGRKCGAIKKERKRF